MPFAIESRGSASTRARVALRRLRARLALLALSIALTASWTGLASAQQLVLLNANANVLGAPDGTYFVDTAALDVEIQVWVAVPTASDAIAFDAQLDLVGSGDALCPVGGPYLPACVQPLQIIPFAVNEIDALDNIQNIVKEAQIALSPAGADAFDAFVAQQVAAGRTVAFRIVFDIDDFYAVDPGTYFFSGTPDLAPLTGVLRFGGITTQLQSFLRLGPCGTAAGWEVQNALADWTPGSDPSWQTASLVLGPPDCALPVLAGSALDLRLTDGSASVVQVDGQLGGLDVALQSVMLDASGAQPFTVSVDLPANASFHGKSVAGNPLPRGQSSIPMGGVAPPASNDFDDLTHTHVLAGGGFLRPEGPPLSFEVGSLQLSGAGLTGDYVGIHYHYDLAYASNDPRSTRGPRSNDARFRVPSVTPGASTFSVTGSGLDAAPQFLASQADTHFPRTQVTFSGYSVDLADSALVDGQSLPHGGTNGYSFVQSPACPGCPVADTLAAPLFTLALARDEGLGFDGAVTALTTAIGQNAQWGPEHTPTLQRIFARRTDDVVPGVVFLPGFRAQYTSIGSYSVSEYLLGMREATDTGSALLPGGHHPLSTDDARAGNYFMAGLNVGPELLRDDQGLPQQGVGTFIDGRVTRIGFGGVTAPDFEDVVASHATKYVLREGGVTGVFNTLTPPQPLVYGHQLALRRFAFRQVSNALDPETWIDGIVSVPNPGGFEISLSSIDLECSGDLAGGRVDRDLCGNMLDDNGNLVIDENCDESLFAWKTPFLVRSAEFKPPDPPPPLCVPSTRDLYVRGRIEPWAFDDPMLLGARWAPSGHPFDASIAGSTERKLDRPDTGPDVDQAFDVSVDSSVELGLDDDETQGWFQMAGLLGLPFWDDLPIDLRVQNRDLQTATPAQTLVFDQGTLAGVPDQQILHNDEEPLTTEMTNPGSSTLSDAHYTWGATTFEFNLPIYYDVGHHDQDEAPRFVGVSSNMHLSLLDAQALVHYVRPDATALSFGASANIERLTQAAADLRMHVDLDDPTSVLAIESFLDTFFGVPGTPVQDLVMKVDEVRTLLACFNNGGLEACITEQLQSALEAALGDADALAQQLTSARGQAAGAVVTANTRLTQAINLTNPSGQLVSTADAAMVLIYQTVPDLIKLQQTTLSPVPSGIPDALGEASDKLDTARAALATAQQQLASAKTAADQAIAQLTTQIMQAGADVQSVKADLNGMGLEVCSQAHPMFLRARDAMEAADSVVTQVRTSSYLSLANSLAGLDPAKVAAAQNSFVDYVDSIKAAIGLSKTRMEDFLACNDPQVSALTGLIAGANQELDGVALSLNGLVGAVQNFRNRLFVDTNLIFPQDGGHVGIANGRLAQAQNVITAIQSVIAAVQAAAAQVPALGGVPMPIYQSAATGDDIRAKWNLAVSQATNGGYQWYYAIPNRSVIDALMTNVNSDLVNAKNLVSQAAAADLDPLLAKIPVVRDGAELIDWISGYIMNHAAVKAFLVRAHELLDEPIDAILGLVNNVLDRVGSLVRLALDAIASMQQNVWVGTDGKLRFSPLAAFEHLDGKAWISGDDLEALHLTARFDFLKDFIPRLLEASISVDIAPWSWQGETKASCIADVALDQVLETSIRIDAPVGDLANVFGIPIQIDTLYYKTLEQTGTDIGSSGGFAVSGDIPLVAVPIAPLPMIIHDVGATWGNTRILRFCSNDPSQVCFHDKECGGGPNVCVGPPLEDDGFCLRKKEDADVECTDDSECTVDPGDYCRKLPNEVEDYFGGRLRASVPGLPAFDSGMFVGKTCSREPLELIDPQAAEFVTFPNGRFNGIYVRGGTNLTIIPGPCFLNMKAGVDVGNWIQPAPAAVVGGLIRGHATGKLMCLAGLRGQMTTALEFSGEGVRFGGEAFGVAGIGIDCDPDTWTSVQNSRNDTWCATADGRVLVKLKNGLWERGSVDVTGLH